MLPSLHERREWPILAVSLLAIANPPFKDLTSNLNQFSCPLFAYEKLSSVGDFVARLKKFVDLSKKFPIFVLQRSAKNGIGEEMKEAQSGKRKLIRSFE